MILFNTLGVCTIQVGSKKLLPNAVHGFAALLYMGIEAGRQIPRAELQALLYPCQDHRTAAHRFRQLLFKLRNLGAPIDCRDDAVVLATRLLHADYSVLLDPPTITEDAVIAARGGFLPGYAPDFSAPFSHWLEDQRTRITHEIVRSLATRLAALRSGGRWRDLEPIARACLVFDSLNELATLALAESLAYIGQNAGAVRVLDDYIADVGTYAKDSRAPARVLRARIAERVQGTGYRRLGDCRFVGRDTEMADLWSHFQRSKRGEPCAVVIHGEPGMGKTRLAAEFAKAAALDGATCVKVECGSYDVRRPMGVFIDLVPGLLDSPGALGVSPQTMDDLRRLTTREIDTGQFTLGAHEPRSASEAIVDALSDLLDAVADENTLVVLIDNGHCADPLSLDVIRSVVSGSAARELLVVMTSRTRLFTESGEGHANRVAMIRVQPLEEAPSRLLAEDALTAAGMLPDADDVTRCVEHAAGNPLYIRAVSSDMGAGAADGRVARSLTQLLQQRIYQLNPRSLRVIAACAVLARRATAGRLAAVVDLSGDELFGALQDLQDRGILDADPSGLRATHPMLAEIALEAVKAGVLQLLHCRCAEQLEREDTALSDAALLWDCARHWEKAGDIAKALQLLRSCAAHCVQIGQPQTACELLQDAERIAPEESIGPVLEEAIAASQLAERFGAVRALIGRYRARRPTVSGHDEYELMAIDAARWEGVPISERRSQLLDCLCAANATPAHRMKAAGMLIICADGLFDSVAAKHAYTIAKELHEAEGRESAMWDYVNVIYQTRFGSPQGTADAARQSMSSSQRTSSPPLAVLLASYAAVGFLVTGSFQDALEAGAHGFQVAQLNGMRTSVVLCAAIIASVHWDFGDRDGAMRWDAIADQALPDRSVLNRALVHVSNKIEFAIASGNTSAARSWLQFAGAACAELQSPQNWCIGRGYEVLISQLEGRDEMSNKELDELLAWHMRARRSLSHDPFVEGLWKALAAANRRETADRLLAEYLGTHRRELYPVRRGLLEIASGRPS